MIGRGTLFTKVRKQKSVSAIFDLQLGGARRRLRSLARCFFFALSLGWVGLFGWLAGFSRNLPPCSHTSVQIQQRRQKHNTAKSTTDRVWANFGKRESPALFDWFLGAIYSSTARHEISQKSTRMPNLRRGTKFGQS